jgi:hypothetical protein
MNKLVEEGRIESRESFDHVSVSNSNLRKENEMLKMELSTLENRFSQPVHYKSAYRDDHRSISPHFQELTNFQANSDKKHQPQCISSLNV